MKKVYIYIADGDAEFYLTERELTSEDFGIDTPYEEEDVLAGCFDDERELARKLRFLFELGYEPAPAMYYDEIKGSLWEEYGYIDEVLQIRSKVF